MKRYQSSGFTMIELLVVITIIGVMSAAIVMNVNPNDPRRDMQKEAMRVVAVFRIAADEAAFQQEEIGVEVFDDGYRFLRWDTGQLEAMDEAGDVGGTIEEQGDEVADAMQENIDQGTDEAADAPEPQWTIIENQRFLKAHDVPDGVRIVLTVDKENIDTDAKEDRKARNSSQTSSDKSKSKSDDLKPSIYFLSSGEATPFTLELSLEGDSDDPIIIEGDMQSRIWEKGGRDDPDRKDKK